MTTNIFDINTKVLSLAKEAMILCAPSFLAVEEITEHNQQRVLKAFIDCKVSESHFYGSTGYGYGDRGRDVLDKVFAQIFGAEDAIVRHNFVSGTHAITVALFGVLRPGDRMLSVTGTPYDTLKNTLGLSINVSPFNHGSLRDFGIKYNQVDLTPDGTVDMSSIKTSLTSDTKMLYIQRSRGYTLRNSLFVSDIEQISQLAKSICPGCIVMVDNCYGEFVEKSEPTVHGADLIAGSLIKNPGGGIAPTGGYIAGRHDLIEQCSYRLTTPGIGREVGATLGHNRDIFLGLYNSPHVTGEALKTAIFTAALAELMGYEVTPKFNEKRADIVQVLKLGSARLLENFCKAIQSASPVDSFLEPIPWEMPGYNHKVIMAAGTFTLGSSIELSADAPLRNPYAVWVQGGINFHSAKASIMVALSKILTHHSR